MSEFKSYFHYLAFLLIPLLTVGCTLVPAEKIYPITKRESEEFRKRVLLQSHVIKGKKASEFPIEIRRAEEKDLIRLAPITSFDWGGSRGREISLVEPSPTGHAVAVAFSGGEVGLLYVRDEDRVCLQNPFPRKCRLELNYQDVFQGKGRTQALAYSDKGDRLAVAYSSMLYVLQPETGKILFQSSKVKGRITKMAWAKDNSQLLVGNLGGEIYGFSRDKDWQVDEYSGANSEITDIIFHPSGRVFFASERAGQIGVWRLASTELEMGLLDRSSLEDKGKAIELRDTIPLSGAEILGLEIDQKGDKLYALTAKGDLFNWSVRGLVPRGSLFSLNAGLNSFALADSLVFLSGRGHRVSTWCVGASPPRKYAISPTLRTPVEGLRLNTKKIIRSEEEAKSKRPLVLWGIQKPAIVTAVGLEETLRQSRETCTLKGEDV